MKLARRLRDLIGVLGLFLSLTFLASSCGIPTEATPSTIAKKEIPFLLLNPDTPTSTMGMVPPVTVVPILIYLVAASQHVAPVVRNVAYPANLTQILGALLKGPTTSESASGLQSFLTGTPNDVVATVMNGIATVNFTTNPVQVVGPDQILAISQVVFTAMAQPGITGVTFEIAGTAVEVPTAGGAQVPGPVNGATYAPEAPVAAPATSTTAR